MYANNLKRTEERNCIEYIKPTERSLILTHSLITIKTKVEKWFKMLSQSLLTASPKIFVKFYV